MPLTAEEFESMFSLFSFGSMRRSSERRLHRRIDADTTATILLLHPGRPLIPTLTRVTDVSRKGVRIVHPTKLNIGDQFILCLSTANSKHTRAILCTVRRSDTFNGKQFRMGCEFVDYGKSLVKTDSVLKGLRSFQAAAADD